MSEQQINIRNESWAWHKQIPASKNNWQAMEQSNYFDMQIFPNAEYLGEDFVDLMKNVLCYSPQRRYTPIQALGHSFFN